MTRPFEERMHETFDSSKPCSSACSVRRRPLLQKGETGEIESYDLLSVSKVKYEAGGTSHYREQFK